VNLMEYRAMVEQEKTESAKGEQPIVQADQVSTDPVLPGSEAPESVSSAPLVPETEAVAPITEEKTIEPTPQVFEIDGQQVTLDELQKGYLRQSDYTRKTQDVARQAREAQDALQLVEQIKLNPEIAKQLNYDPIESQNRLLEQNYYDLLLQQEVNTLSTKYADFEVSEVLDYAVANQLQNLEHAYLLNKQLNVSQASPISAPSVQAVNVDALKAQIRQELLAEQNTSTIISAQGTPPVAVKDLKLSNDELRVAKNMHMTPEQYAKWRG
jgi:hypothetical protein